MASAAAFAGASLGTALSQAAAEAAEKGAHESHKNAVATCPSCGGGNPPQQRYCSSCGFILGVRSSSPSEVVANAPSDGALQDSLGREVRESESRDTVRVCPRCQGVSDTGASFCRYCGSHLAMALSMESGHGNGHESGHLSGRAAGEPAGTGQDLGDEPTSQAPIEPGYGRILVIDRDGVEGASFPLLGSLDIGRTEGDVRIADDVYVCPRHARLTVRGDEVWIIDLASVNGVYLRFPVVPAKQVLQSEPRGQSPEASSTQPTAVPLQDQDLFLVGQQVIKFEIVREAEEGFGSASQRGTLVFGTPLTARYARLSILSVEGVAREIYYIRKSETAIGRESGDILFTDDPFLSRRHALVQILNKERREFQLVDLRSSNGTYLKMRGESRLEGGSQFRIGQQLFRFDRSAHRRSAT